MKKMTVHAKAAAAVLVSALVLSSAGVIAAETKPVSVTEEQAVKTALAHFGLTEEDVTGTKTELDDGKYEIRMTADGIRFECDVSALTGTVVDSELKSRLLDNELVAAYVKKNGFISAEDAKALALEKFGIKAHTEITDFVMELDDNDYEVEFVADGVKHECDVSAVTGKIVFFKSRNLKLLSDIGQTQGAAKKAALEYFGIADGTEVYGMEADADDGRYEVEFHLDGTEYECDIDRSTGEVLKAKINDRFVSDPASAAAPAVKAESTAPAASAENTASGGTLTEEEALATALSALGITEADYTRVECERDDGKYEFEFEGGAWEYECDVHMTTGAVSDMDKDLDD